VSLVVTRRRRDSLFAAFSIFFQTKIKFQICNSIELVFPKSTAGSAWQRANRAAARKSAELLKYLLHLLGNRPLNP